MSKSDSSGNPMLCEFCDEPAVFASCWFYPGTQEDCAHGGFPLCKAHYDEWDENYGSTGEGHDIGIRYLLCPGSVISKNDGQTHYINAPELAKLYGVSLEECEIIDRNRWSPYRYLGLIRLEPRFDGNYTLPAEEVQS